MLVCESVVLVVPTASSVVADGNASPNKRSALKTICPPLAKPPSAKAREPLNAQLETNATANIGDFFMEHPFLAKT